MSNLENTLRQIGFPQMEEGGFYWSMVKAQAY